MSAIVKRLRELIEAEYFCSQTEGPVREAADEIERLQKEAKAYRWLLQKDAARYRWLRDNAGCPFAETDDAWDGGDNLDAAIDAAMQEQPR